MINAYLYSAIIIVLILLFIIQYKTPNSIFYLGEGSKDILIEDDDSMFYSDKDRILSRLRRIVYHLLSNQPTGELLPLDDLIEQLRLEINASGNNLSSDDRLLFIKLSDDNNYWFDQAINLPPDCNKSITSHEDDELGNELGNESGNELYCLSNDKSNSIGKKKFKYSADFIRRNTQKIGSQYYDYNIGNQSIKLKYLISQLLLIIKLIENNLYKKGKLPLNKILAIDKSIDKRDNNLEPFSNGTNDKSLWYSPELINIEPFESKITPLRGANIPMKNKILIVNSESPMGELLDDNLADRLENDTSDHSIESSVIIDHLERKPAGSLLGMQELNREDYYTTRVNACGGKAPSDEEFLTRCVKGEIDYLDALKGLPSSGIMSDLY